jgi:hypothetical protein
MMMIDDDSDDDDIDDGVDRGEVEDNDGHKIHHLPSGMDSQSR